MQPDHTTQLEPAGTQQADGVVRPLQPRDVPQTLAAQLTPLVDQLRQLAVDFGVRPYRAYLVHVAWTGNSVGDGSAVETSRREILPTPRVRDMGGLGEILESFGTTEAGSLTVDRISARFSEDELMGLTPDLLDPVLPRTGARNREFFWIIQENRPSCPPGRPRRFIPAAAPTLLRAGMEWRITLKKQELDPARNGNTFDRRAQ
jgi:hypothetical protein